MNNRKVVVVLPAYNEGARIADVVRKVRTYVDEVIVADDGSKDSTSEEARQIGAIVVRHRINLGKGAALQTGVQAAILRGAKTIVLMDADGQHPPEKIPELVEKIHGGAYDIVFAYRKHDHEMPGYRRFGNQWLNFSVRFLFGMLVSDVWCGFRAFRADIYPLIQWQRQNYSVDVEMALRAAQHKLRYCEVPIPTIYHDVYKGVSIVDGIRLLLNILIWRFTL
ncbi:MAG: glycosyltransferase family 2 protein [Patescibacteria group bacterium]|jgi:glycosyltransferase involved in cell wall biosynthesis